MSKNKKSYIRGSAGGRDRSRSRVGRVSQVSVRGVRRAEPDYRKYAQVVIDLAQAQVEADAQEQHEAAAQRADDGSAAIEHRDGPTGPAEVA